MYYLFYFNSGDRYVGLSLSSRSALSLFFFVCFPCLSCWIPSAALANGEQHERGEAKRRRNQPFFVCERVEERATLFLSLSGWYSSGRYPAATCIEQLLYTSKKNPNGGEFGSLILLGGAREPNRARRENPLRIDRILRPSPLFSTLGYVALLRLLLLSFYLFFSSPSSSTGGFCISPPPPSSISIEDRRSQQDLQ